MKYQDPLITGTDLMEDFIVRPQPHLLASALQGVGAGRKKDPKNRVFAMGILRGEHRKVPI